MPGPRIFAATKSIATTGGHADPTNSLRHDLMGDPGPLAGVINGPDEAREFFYMVEAGMPALEALQSATLRAAELLGNEDQAGSLATGKLADIIAVPGDPSEDINLMMKVNFVMKGGVIYKHTTP